MQQPTNCSYAPAGEYIKDHTLMFHDGWWHLFSISGIAGYYHGYNGNEETISWSISQDLINWEMRGHVLHASQWPEAFDRDEVWAPFCMKADNRFYLFYTGVIHPTRPLEYRKLGHDHPFILQGHKETQGLAISDDLTRWTKIGDFQKGLGIPGRDSHVIRDEANHRWLLYSTGGGSDAYVSFSADLVRWSFIGTCAQFPGLCDENNRRLWSLNESLTVMKHPLNGRWIMLGNLQYFIADDPTNFQGGKASTYFPDHNQTHARLGTVGEIIEWQGRWYRSGMYGKRDYWKLGFTEIRWVPDGAFEIVAPSVMAANSEGWQM